MQTEVPRAADADASVKASALLFAAAGAVSGALTTPLLNLLNRIDWLSNIDLGSVSVSMVLAGAAFAVALAGALIWQLGFSLRRLFIIVAVLAGWYVALEVFVQREAEPPRGLGETQVQSELDQQCQDLDAGRLTAPTPELEKACDELKLQMAQLELSRTKVYWNSLITHGLSGAIGAFLTVLGVSLATGRRFPITGMAAATGAGVVVAMLFYVVVSAVSALRFAEYYTLFIPWQAAVAGVIGRFMR